MRRPLTCVKICAGAGGRLLGWHWPDSLMLRLLNMKQIIVKL